MASLIFDSFWEDLARGAIDLDTDTFNVTLHTSTYTENKGTQLKFSDVTNEVTGTGYTAGGKAVTCTVSKDTTNHRVDAVFAATSWTTSTITARKAVIRKARGGAATADELVAVIDFGSDVISSAGTFSLTASTVRITN